MKKVSKSIYEKHYLALALWHEYERGRQEYADELKKFFDTAVDYGVMEKGLIEKIVYKMGGVSELRFPYPRHY